MIHNKKMNTIIFYKVRLFILVYPTPMQVKTTCSNISSFSLNGSILKTIPKKSFKSLKNCILWE